MHSTGITGKNGSKLLTVGSWTGIYRTQDIDRSQTCTPPGRGSAATAYPGGEGGGGGGGGQRREEYCMTEAHGNQEDMLGGSGV